MPIPYASRDCWRVCVTAIDAPSGTPFRGAVEVPACAPGYRPLAAFFPRSAGIPGLELDGFCVLHDRTLRSHDPRPLVEPGFGFAPIETRGASPPVLLWDHRSASWIVPSGSLGREYDFVAQLVGVEEIDLGDGALYVFACPAGCEMRAKYQR